MRWQWVSFGFSTKDPSHGQRARVPICVCDSHRLGPDRRPPAPPRHIQQRLAWAHHQTPVVASKRNIPQRDDPETWNQPWQQRSHLACSGAASGIRAKTFGQPPRDPWTKKRLAVEAPALKGKRLTAQPMATDWL